MLREQQELIAVLVRAESVSFVDSIPEDLVATRGMQLAIHSGNGDGSFNETETLELQDTAIMVGDLNSEVRPLSQSIQDAAGSAERALDQAEVTLKTADGVISRDSPLRRDLEAALRNLTAASKSIRNLADQLERNPNAILTGKQ